MNGWTVVALVTCAATFGVLGFALGYMRGHYCGVQQMIADLSAAATENNLNPALLVLSGGVLERIKARAAARATPERT